MCNIIDTTKLKGSIKSPKEIKFSKEEKYALKRLKGEARKLFWTGLLECKLVGKPTFLKLK